MTQIKPGSAVSPESGPPEDMRRLLEPGERILWAGKPAREVIVKQSATSLLILSACIAFLLAVARFIPRATGGKPSLLFIAVMIFAIILGLLGICPLLEYKNLYYVITDRRLIVRRGAVGVDYDFLNLGHVQQISLDRGYWDVKHNTGTITVKSAELAPITLAAVRDPHAVYRVLAEAVEEARRRAKATS